MIVRILRLWVAGSRGVWSCRLAWWLGRFHGGSSRWRSIFVGLRGIRRFGGGWSCIGFRSSSIPFSRRHGSPWFCKIDCVPCLSVAPGVRGRTGTCCHRDSTPFPWSFCKASSWLLKIRLDKDATWWSCSSNLDETHPPLPMWRFPISHRRQEERESRGPNWIAASFGV